MNITRIPITNNFRSGRNGQTPIGIVIHIMDGTLEETDQRFKDPASLVSAHYGVGTNGDLHIYVDEKDTALHTGLVNAPIWKKIKILDPGIPSYLDPDLYTVGIQHEGYKNTPWTDEVYQTSSTMIAVIANRWGIRLNRDHVIGHQQINSLANCPGSMVDIDRLIWLAIVQTALGPLPTIEPGTHLPKIIFPPNLPNQLNPPPSSNAAFPADSQDQTGTLDIPQSKPTYNIYNKVVKSGTVTTIHKLNIRSAPGINQWPTRTVPANGQLSFDGYIDNGPLYEGITKWYYTNGGDWFWSGAVQ